MLSSETIATAYVISTCAAMARSAEIHLDLWSAVRFALSIYLRAHVHQKVGRFVSLVLAHCLAERLGFCISRAEVYDEGFTRFRFVLGFQALVNLVAARGALIRSMEPLLVVRQSRRWNPTVEPKQLRTDKTYRLRAGLGRHKLSKTI